MEKMIGTLLMSRKLLGNMPSPVVPFQDRVAESETISLIFEWSWLDDIS